MSTSSQPAVRVPADDLRGFYLACLAKLGTPDEHARMVADAILDADLRGVDTHGINRFPTYVSRVVEGGITPGAAVTVLRDDGSTVLIDGGDGFGQVAATKAMRLAVERCAKFGVAAVAVRRSSHLGTLAYYSMMALPAGAIGFAASGTASVIAPWGAAEALLGSNPWSFAIPARRYPPIVVDYANSIIAAIGGRIRTEWARAMPPGIALDRDGNPTTDPTEALAGSIRPIGGHKGYGLTLVMEVLASVLPGAALAYDVPPPDEPGRARSLGHFMMAIDISRFAEMGTFLDRVDDLVGRLKGARRGPEQPGALIPGERAHESCVDRSANGIPVSAYNRGRVLAVARSLDVSAPFGA